MIIKNTFFTIPFCYEVSFLSTFPIQSVGPFSILFSDELRTHVCLVDWDGLWKLPWKTLNFQFQQGWVPRSSIPLVCLYYLPHHSCCYQMFYSISYHTAKKNKLVLWFYNFVYRRLCCICFLAISVNFLKASAFWSLLFKTFIDNLLASPLFVLRWSRPHKRTTEESYGITYFEDWFFLSKYMLKLFSLFGITIFPEVN